MRLPSRSVETSREAFDFHEKGIGFGRCPFRVSNSRSSLSVNTMREAASDTPGSPKTTVSARTGRGYRYAVTANTLEDRNATHVMKKLICFYGSEKRSNRESRRIARMELRRGREPQRIYRTGKFWTD